jgi:hypothetical protein
MTRRTFFGIERKSNPVSEVETMARAIKILAAACMALAAVGGFGSVGPVLPVRGLHLAAPKPADLPDALRFIREALPKEGVNTLVLEFNYGFKYASHPEVVDADALSRDEVKSIVAACREASVRLIPQVNLLGHQSWAKTTYGLLRAHPEFDETPGKYPQNEGIYCRSYCPLHPDVHAMVFDLVDEIVEACESDAFHAGMDEVFLLGDDACPRCKGRNKAELFAQEVRAIRDHLAEKKRTLWIWGDRFIDGDLTGIGEWEASRNQTAAALRQIPKDIVICDWHYENAPPTALYFAMEGFPVVSCPWRKVQPALALLDLVRHARKNAPDAIGARTMGVLQTTWCGMGPFVKAYFGDTSARPAVVESVLCFREVFRDIRSSIPQTP